MALTVLLKFIFQIEVMAFENNAIQPIGLLKIVTFLSFHYFD